MSQVPSVQLLSPAEILRYNDVRFWMVCSATACFYCSSCSDRNSNLNPNPNPNPSPNPDPICMFRGVQCHVPSNLVTITSRTCRSHIMIFQITHIGDRPWRGHLVVSTCEAEYGAFPSLHLRRACVKLSCRYFGISLLNLLSVQHAALHPKHESLHLYTGTLRPVSVCAMPGRFYRLVSCCAHW